LAVIELKAGGPAIVIEQVAGLEFEELQRLTAIELTPGPH